MFKKIFKEKSSILLDPNEIEKRYQNIPREITQMLINHSKTIDIFFSTPPPSPLTLSQSEKKRLEIYYLTQKRDITRKIIYEKENKTEKNEHSLSEIKEILLLLENKEIELKKEEEINKKQTGLREIPSNDRKRNVFSCSSAFQFIQLMESRIENFDEAIYCIKIKNNLSLLEKNKKEREIKKAISFLVKEETGIEMPIEISNSIYECLETIISHGNERRINKEKKTKDSRLFYAKKRMFSFEKLLGSIKKQQETEEKTESRKRKRDDEEDKKQKLVGDQKKSYGNLKIDSFFRKILLIHDLSKMEVREISEETTKHLYQWEKQKIIDLKKCLEDSNEILNSEMKKKIFSKISETEKILRKFIKIKDHAYYGERMTKVRFFHSLIESIKLQEITETLQKEFDRYSIYPSEMSSETPEERIFNFISQLSFHSSLIEKELITSLEEEEMCESIKITDYLFLNSQKSVYGEISDKALENIIEDDMRAAALEKKIAFIPEKKEKNFLTLIYKIQQKKRIEDIEIQIQNELSILEKNSKKYENNIGFQEKLKKIQKTGEIFNELFKDMDIQEKELREQIRNDLSRNILSL